MKYANPKHRSMRHLAVTAATSARIEILAILAALAIVLFAIASVWANRSVARAGSRLIELTHATVVAQGGGGGSKRDPHDKLSLQPEADRFRHRLGQRFNQSGHEHARIIGVLTVGTQQFQARIDRTQDDDGEQVEISLNGGGGSLTWNEKDGARSNGRNAIGIERSLIERLVLDSPDEFVLAQMRGASYYTVARNVIPEEAGGEENYSGPAWNIVRIDESQTPSPSQPQSTWRLYYINNSTGLIDKVISREQGDTMTADISGWAKDGTEAVPTHTRWTLGGQVVMEFLVTNVAHGPK